MKSLLRRRMLMLVILLIGVLVFAGCNKEELSNLTVKISDGNGNAVVAKANITREGKTLSDEGEIVQFKEIPIGEYKLEVEAEGYEVYEGNIVLKEADEIKEVILEELDSKEEPIEKDNQESEKIEEEAVEEEVVEEEVVEEVSKINLSLNIFDINQNLLDADVMLKGEDKVIGIKTGSKVTFKDLVPGDYTVKAVREGYPDLKEKITVDEDNKELSLVMAGGRVGQYLLDGSKEKIEFNNLTEDDELIIAISYLNKSDSKVKFDLNNRADRLAKIEYDVRRKGIQLVKKYGADFKVDNPDYSFGEVKEFKVANDVKKSTVTATLEGVGDHIYVFVDNKKDVELSKVDKLISEFDNKIYPGIIGSDEDDKVVVLLTDFDSPYVTGYFDPADLYAGQGNEEIMFYLNGDRDENTLLTAAAHQCQHLFFYVNKAKANRTVDDAWIDQGLAQLAQRLCGYIDFEKEGWSSNQGNGWVYDKDYGYLNNTNKVDLLVHDGSLPFSGGSVLFADYIAENYGPGIIELIMTSPQDPVKVIEEYTGKKFSRVYMNWMTANVADTIASIDNEVYNYSSFNLKELPAFNNGSKISNRGINYYRIKGHNGDLTIPLPGGDEELGIVIIERK